VVKEPIKTFVPVNPAEGKKAIKNDVFTIFDNEYDLLKDKKRKDMFESKTKMGPAFKTASIYDNATGKDWT
jgi:hypothetical protein